jgi:hypothetical protein
MNQMIFAIDPDFTPRYNEKYMRNGAMLTGLNYDDEVLSRYGKDPYIDVSFDENHLYITAVQYWKVVGTEYPNVSHGFDGMRLRIAIDLGRMKPELLLLTPDCGRVTMMYHGFRETPSEIAC